MRDTPYDEEIVQHALLDKVRYCGMLLHVACTALNLGTGDEGLRNFFLHMMVRRYSQTVLAIRSCVYFSDACTLLLRTALGATPAGVLSAPASHKRARHEEPRSLQPFACTDFITAVVTPIDFHLVKVGKFQLAGGGARNARNTHARVRRVLCH